MSRCKPVTATQILSEIDDAHKRNYIKENFSLEGIFSPEKKVVDLLTNAGARNWSEGRCRTCFAIPKSWNCNDDQLIRRLFEFPCNKCGVHYETRFIFPVDNGCNEMDLYCLYNIRDTTCKNVSVKTGIAPLKQSVSKSQSWYELTDKIRALIVD